MRRAPACTTEASPFVEATLGFPSSPEYPRYRVDRKKALPALYSALFENAPLDEHLAEDLAVCAAVTVCAPAGALLFFGAF